MREKILNFGNVITKIPTARPEPVVRVCGVCWKCEVLKKETICNNAIAKIGEGEKNCRNIIAENEKGKKLWLPKFGE